VNIKWQAAAENILLPLRADIFMTRLEALGIL
jgi:hypothetical protein